jgi:hypothetical protein
MRNSTSVLLALAAAVVATSGCDPAAPQPSGGFEIDRANPPPPTVGRLDLGETCHRSYGSSFTPVLPALYDPTSWKCQSGAYQLDLPFDTGCTEQYGAGSRGVLSNRSWGCSAAAVDHCAQPNGSALVTLASLTPSGKASAAGYEVYGEPALWNLTLKTNQFTPTANPNAQLVVPLAWNGLGIDFHLSNDSGTVYTIGTEPITSSSPLTRTVTANAPCGTLSATTPRLLRADPSASPVPAISASATYVNPGTPVTLTITRDPAKESPTACISNSRLRIVGKQPYDSVVVVDATYDSNFYTKTLTVQPNIDTEYTATMYCNLNKALSASAKVTVKVWGGNYTCSNGTPPEQHWFCRDCPYNSPPLTNTLIYSACSYDEASNLAWGTSFGGACNITDGKCASCPNPDDCGF